jgi:hypothetical protein
MSREQRHGCLLELHAQYGFRDIQAVLGRATLETAGQTGVGVLHFASVRAYALLITYRKTEREFSPSTMYADYPISRELLHWELQSNTTQESETGRNLIHHAVYGELMYGPILRVTALPKLSES